jgi:hypothetical protein
MWPVNGTLSEIITRMRYLRPAFELREHWHYNNIVRIVPFRATIFSWCLIEVLKQYIVAAHLINIYSGHNVSEFVGNRIFKVLNMTTTTLNYGDALASGHLSDAFHDTCRTVPNPLGDDAQLWSGPGGIMSNAVDLGKWLTYLLHASGDTPSGGLPWNMLSKTWTPFTFVEPPAPVPFDGTITYGMGWFQGVYRGHEVCTSSSAPLEELMRFSIGHPARGIVARRFI